MEVRNMYLKLQELVDSRVFYWRKEDGRGLILHKISSKKDTKGFEVYTDLGTIALLELAKLHIPYEQIVSMIQNNFGMSRENTEAILYERLSKLLGFTTEVLSPYPQAHPYSYSAPHLAAVEITTHCNLTCNYCYAHSGPHVNLYMSFEQFYMHSMNLKLLKFQFYGLLEENPFSILRLTEY